MNKEEIKEELESAAEFGLKRAQALSKSLDQKPLLDRIMGKAISRKFLTFLTATGLLMYAGLDSETWGMIAIVYIGSQSVVDFALAWKHGPNA